MTGITVWRARSGCGVENGLAGGAWGQAEPSGGCCGDTGRDQVEAGRWRARRHALGRPLGRGNGHVTACGSEAEGYLPVSWVGGRMAVPLRTNVTAAWRRYFLWEGSGHLFLCLQPLRSRWLDTSEPPRPREPAARSHSPGKGHIPEARAARLAACCPPSVRPAAETCPCAFPGRRSCES